MAAQAFIVGGTGQIGRAVAGDLLGKGWSVTLSSRGRRPMDGDLVQRGVKVVQLDRDEPGALAAALAGGADAVIDTVAYGQDHADQLLAVQGDVGAVVVISSASVYADQAGRTLDEAGQNGFPDFLEPIGEDQATVAPGPDTYSTRKVALERRLLDDASIPVTILRPCAIHGLYSTHPREWWFVKRMLDGRAVIPLAYGGKSLFHTSAAANIAAVAAAALERPGTRVLNVGDPDVLTVAEIGASIGQHLGWTGRFAPLEGGNPDFVGHTPWSTPAPFTLDCGAAASLGYRPATTYRGAVGPVCDWLTATASEGDWKARFAILAGYSIDLFDYAGENRFLAANA